MDTTTKHLQAWMNFAKDVFIEADERVSLDKAQDEINELQMEFQMNDSEMSKERELEEYADIIMCLLHSAARRGYSASEVVEAFKVKQLINSERIWKKNPNNTYSHIK